VHGLSLAVLQLAVDAYVYFANVRPAYKWACFGDCVVYSFTRPDRLEQCVVFWNIKTDERCVDVSGWGTDCRPRWLPHETPLAAL